MNQDLERRIVNALREAKTPALPLRQLYGRIVAEAGPATGSYARFAEELRSSQRFLMLEPEDPLGDGYDWPPGVRSLYQAELAESEFEAGPHIALAPAAAAADSEKIRRPGITADEDEATTPLERAHASMLQLLENAPDNAALRKAIAHAMNDCSEMRRRLGT